MDKDLKQMHHVKWSNRSSKKIAALSFLAALQTVSCVTRRGQGLINTHNTHSGSYIDLAGFSERSPDGQVLQAKTRDTLGEHSPDLNGKTAFFQAVEKCDFPLVRSLSKDPFITSKEIVKALFLALQAKDTLSFRYKHEKIVRFLLEELFKQYVPFSLISLKSALCMKDNKGRGLLHLLIRRGDIYGMQFLVKKLVSLLCKEDALEVLCAQDGKGRTLMLLTACYKSKKMFNEVFKQIYNLDPVRAIQEVFKKDKNGYSVIERGYLRKDRHFAELLNNSHIQLPTFCRKGSKMFKFILKTIPVPLAPDQLVTVAIDLDKTLEGKIISPGYAATLRAILKRYIEGQYGYDAVKVVRYVAYKRQLDYIENQYGSNSKEVQVYKNQHKKLVQYISKKYSSQVEEPVCAVDEGYVSG